MASVPRRFGVTVPFPGVALHEHREWYEEVATLGFTDVWSGEANSHDGFTPLALAAAWAPTLRSGVAIAPAFTRGPALLAQTAASMSDAAPGRFALGIGASSPAIVERWNAVPFEQPLERTRDVLRFLRTALTGEKVTERYETFEIQGFRLGVVPATPPPLLVAALRPRMLRLAGEEGDGAIVNWLSAEDVKTVAPIVGEDKEVAARIFVLPTEDRDTVRAIGRRMVAEYLNVPVYAAFHEWIGRGDALQPMWDAWKSGDRAGAVEAVPDAVLDDLIVWGSPEQCAEGVRRYADNGITTPAPMIIADPPTAKTTIRALAKLKP